MIRLQGIAEKKTTRKKLDLDFEESPATVTTVDGKLKLNNNRGNNRIDKIKISTNSPDSQSNVNNLSCNDPCLDNESPNLISTEIPSTILKYPRRINLGLCLKLRRNQLSHFMVNENEMSGGGGSSSSCSSSGESLYGCPPSQSSSTCQLPGQNNALEGETLKFRRRKLVATENKGPANKSSTIHESTIGSPSMNSRLKLGNTDTHPPHSNCNYLSQQNKTTTATTTATTTTATRNNKYSSHSHRRKDEAPSQIKTGTGGGRTTRPGRNGGVVGGFRFSLGASTRILFVLFYLLIFLLDSSVGCGPGRGAGRRRAPRKLTPLVYKQHVPNVPENTLSASGLNEGKINRDHPRFKALVPNYNTDIIFRDDEGTGADRLMSQRCKEKLNTLAISVMNQWPGVRLRVIEGWDEGSHHSTSSLHYEGRAVDITTSDKDRSKYGMLARLAVEAGFDWVYYESRAHIHCSVKSDPGPSSPEHCIEEDEHLQISAYCIQTPEPNSSQSSRTGGCFSNNATVITLEGRRQITDIRPGDSVLSVNDMGKTVFSEVVMFLDLNSTERREFYHVTTSSGNSLALTPSHLIFTVDRLTGDGLLQASNSDSNSISTSNLLYSNTSLTQQEIYASAVVTFAKNIEAGDWLLVLSQSSLTLQFELEKVVGIEARLSTGVYAPLTKQGTVIVDGILASCYAVVNDQSLAHWAFSPVRFAVNVYEAMGHAWTQFSRFVSFRPLYPHSKTQESTSALVPLAAVSQNEPSTIRVRKVEENDSDLKARSTHVPPSRGVVRDQGVHWYASFLYSIGHYVIPSNLLYESS